MSIAKMNKQDYYEILVRNRYYLWAYSSNVCTMDNLDDAKQGRQYVWCTMKCTSSLALGHHLNSS